MAATIHQWIKELDEGVAKPAKIEEEPELVGEKEEAKPPKRKKSRSWRNRKGSSFLRKHKEASQQGEDGLEEKATTVLLDEEDTLSSSPSPEW